MPQVLLRPDAWLGAQLGLEAFHMGFGAGKVDADDISAALAPLRHAGAAFVDASIDVRSLDLANACAGAGMRLIDTNLRLARPGMTGPAAPHAGHVREAKAADRPAVEAIAASSLRLSRFHADPAIAQPRADALKAAWAGNYFTGARGDGMLVAEAEGKPVGFLLYLLKDEGLVIDLIAVAAAQRGKGLGASLVAEAARSTKAARLITGTQLANAPAAAFYEGLGFRIVGAGHMFHFHGKANENRPA